MEGSRGNLCHVLAKKWRELGGRLHVRLGEREGSAYHCHSCSATLCVKHTSLFLAWFIVQVKKYAQHISQMDLFRSARFDLIAVDAFCRKPLTILQWHTKGIKSAWRDICILKREVECDNEGDGWGIGNWLGAGGGRRRRS